ncbi:zinc finger MYND domain-containing protein 11-like [Pollicipes pollicipes]|uniref:zinc finger MYND domain-containing protein 11-like n=1 Tax=Pollicipes pollicipes TaxID=41117 RepID=UPI001884E232|nr:zinc finger MYND domain-containing protein 11-like [Pollicipes pollicipes]
MTGRKSDPTIVHLVWDAIQSCMTQRQQPNFERVSKHIMRFNSISPDVIEDELSKVVDDGLVRFVQRLGAKGSKKGEEQELYKLPKGPPAPSEHDWYCASCHQPGELLACSGCPSARHSKCLTEAERQTPFTCPQCQMAAAEQCDIKKKTLNTLLGYTVLRLKARMLPLTAEDAGVLSPSSDPEQRFRTAYLLYRPLEIFDIEDKLDRQVYSKLSEFEGDVRLMVHNIIVMNGAESQAAAVAGQVLQDCLHDVQEIRICRDCYRMSNEKPGKNWFCRPCRPPHELVFAKQKGYPFWPAKVMKTENDMFDVRFFGEPHERAFVTRGQIRPITTSLQALQIKRSNPWTRAHDELKRHQAQLRRVEEQPSLLNSDSEPGLESEPESTDSPLREGAAPPPTKRRRRAFDPDEDWPEPQPRTVATQTPAKFLRTGATEQQHELASLDTQYRQQLSASKRKQWCFNCEQEAIYHCCWNTAYCSTECQQVHWHKEHKRVCRRKRTL